METIIGVVLGALIGIIGTILNYHLLLRQQRRKEAKQAIADVASALGAMYAMMESLCWEAGETPQRLPDARLTAYGQRIEMHLERFFGVLPLVAVQDASAYENLRAQAEQAKEIDGRIDKAVWQANAQARAQQCKACQVELQTLYNTLMTIITTVLKRI